ncbi:MAG: type II toxin-antitoxin system PemK/MazF family toxin [Bacteroidetes bacterium]|nr:type II toxin-antitoxin system PemK/MazF family toxin [Bacteroidota bacterium]
MNKLHFGDIVLLKFPFTETTTFKRRPALIINHGNDGDIIVCRITSQLYSTQNDVAITDWKNAGLKLPSVIRVHKIATLESSIIETIMGKIDSTTKNKVKTVFSKLSVD